MNNLFRGDVVTIKSGGPRMTITNIRQQRSISGFPGTACALCQWFENDALMEKWFDVIVLESAKETVQRTV
ncbi:YodC family protein [Pseudomonas putida]|uniref:YodC family protein n=1 Tax=Pseudomonas putida TaxID=303 RepID=UPI000E048BAF|nr:DUF2158 domain-containing protein [Pseudomonas putida]SUD78546.1 Uncharacterized small protein [Pseudomonas putida]